MGRSNDPTQRQRRRSIAAALLLPAVGLLVAGGALALPGRAPHTGAQIDNAQMERALPPPTFEGSFTETPHQVPKVERERGRPIHKKPVKPVRIQMPVPSRIDIPAIAASAPVIPLGLNADRTLEVPSNFGETGWFTGGPEPGEPGAAVIVGHVDSQSGPAVFYRLRALRAGDVIKIRLKDNSTVRYIVYSTLAAPKNRFPAKLVYSQTKKPTLRLITCDGQFDSSTGHYLDNYIVFARIAGARQLR
jgi:LPXTG-site transpeptidase (sortase) family protein